MAISLLVNVDPFETRAAYLEDGKLMDLQIERRERVVGNVYKGRVVNVLPGMDAGFVDIGLPRNGFIYVSDVLPGSRVTDWGEPPSPVGYHSINEALRPGDEIVAQVMRPPVGSKGARLTTRISLQGRFVVMVAHGGEQVSVSRRIEDDEERSRLHRLLDRIRPFGHGIIARREAEGRSPTELTRDVELLLQRWHDIRERAKLSPAPATLHSDLGLVARAVRDLFSRDVHELVVDDPAAYEEIVGILRSLDPDMIPRVKLYEERVPVFEAYDLEAESARVLDRAVPLPSGGYLTFDETEALTAIDVNTGHYVGQSHPAQTVLQSNLEAVAECARQMRLRDLGGIIVIDFIDMDRVRDRVQVMNALERVLRRDPMRTRIVHISPLGLVELTRQRRGESLSRLLCESCATCDGRGLVRSALTVCIDLRRKLRRMASKSHSEAYLLTLHPEVAAHLVGPEGQAAEALEKELNSSLSIRVDPGRHHEKFTIDSGSCEEIARQFPSCPSGLRLSVHLNRDTFPATGPLFAAAEGRLIRLRGLEENAEGTFEFVATEQGRWFVEAGNVTSEKGE